MFVLLSLFKHSLEDLAVAVDPVELVHNLANFSSEYSIPWTCIAKSMVKLSIMLINSILHFPALYCVYSRLSVMHIQ